MSEWKVNTNNKESKWRLDTTNNASRNLKDDELEQICQGFVVELDDDYFPDNRGETESLFLPPIISHRQVHPCRALWWWAGQAALFDRLNTVIARKQGMKCEAAAMF